MHVYRRVRIPLECQTVSIRLGNTVPGLTKLSRVLFPLHPSRNPISSAMKETAGRVDMASGFLAEEGRDATRSLPSLLGSLPRTEQGCSLD
ncbi:hypothetical protein MTO96_012991 [Rhipicephalus appendiculatus]